MQSVILRHAGVETRQTRLFTGTNANWKITVVLATNALVTHKYKVYRQNISKTVELMYYSHQYIHAGGRIPFWKYST